MKLTLLKTFIRVVETRNLSRTAEELNISQPAVSKQIQALEDMYGVMLLERSGRRLKTTEAGELLYNSAIEVVKTLEKTDRLMEELLENRRGKIFLGASSIPGQYILPRCIKEFKEEYPNVTISMEVSDTERIFNKIMEREIDVGVIGSWINSRKVEGFPWLEEELMIAVPRDHRLGKQKTVKLENVSGERWVIRERGSGTRMAMEAVLAQANMKIDDLNVQAELGSTSAVLAAVEAGMGITMVSSLALAKSGTSGLTALKLDGVEARRKFYVIYPRQKNRRITVNNFIEFLKRYNGIS